MLMYACILRKTPSQQSFGFSRRHVTESRHKHHMQLDFRQINFESRPVMPLHPCLAAAIGYLKLGWSVIPLCTHDHAGVPGLHQKECTTPGKAPLWPWKQYQEKAMNASALRLLWSRCPTCNVGIVMGPVSNLIGFDVDGPAGMKFLDDLTADNPLPPTLQFDTPGGGLRYLFQWPKEYETRLRTLAPGSQPIVRILAEGTQIAAPPSIHWTGKPY